VFSPIGIELLILSGTLSLGCRPVVTLVGKTCSLVSHCELRTVTLTYFIMFFGKRATAEIAGLFSRLRNSSQMMSWAI
jgi:hypothetical protein